MFEKKVKENTFDKLTEDQQREPMPYYQHALAMARIGLQCKRWFIMCLVLLLLFVGTNVAWIIYENQYETYYVEQDVDTGDGSAYVAGVGDVNYGENQTSNQNPGEEGGVQ